MQIVPAPNAVGAVRISQRQRSQTWFSIRPRGRRSYSVTLLGLSTFGPYVAMNARTDQFVLYGAAVLMLPYLHPRIALSGPLGVMTFAWLWGTSG